jgi:hypothetical protein
MKKVRADLVWGMLATIQFRIFSLSVLYLQTKRLKYAKTTFLPVVLYGCETWSLSLSKGHID